MADAYPITSRNRLRRRHERGHYDRETVHGILDAAMICHIAYVIDGQPFCTPTSFWREGDRLYWHGSSASRMVRAPGEGPAGLPDRHASRRGRPGALGLPPLGELPLRHGLWPGAGAHRPQAKLHAMDAFIDRFYPGRTALLRPPTVQEIKAITILEMAIEDAMAKIRCTGVSDEEEDYALPVWCAVLPLRTVLGEPEECPRQLPGVTPEARGMAVFRRDAGSTR